MSTIETGAALYAALQQLPADERAAFAALYAAGAGTTAVVLQLVTPKAGPLAPAPAAPPSTAQRIEDVGDMDDEEADLSAEDAADYLGVSAQVLRRYIKAGQIKAARGRPGSPPLYPLHALRDLKASLKR